MPASLRPKTAKKWYRAHAYGQSVDVWVYEEYHLLGEYSPDEGIIIVKRSTPGRMYDTLIHELFHFGMEASSAQFNLKDEFGFKHAIWLKFIERLVRYLAPMALMLFHGMLRFPKIPGRGREDE